MKIVNYISFRTFLEMNPDTVALDTLHNWQMVDLFDDYMKKIILPVITTNRLEGE